MKVGIITCVNCMTCMFAVALTMGGPIRRQASQSEKTVPIGGNVTLLCPFVTDDTLQWIYWQKNNRTIYARRLTTTTNDTKYEGITSYATPLTIKDLKKTDRGIYHCIVSTSVSATVEEGGHVKISVTEDKTTLSPEWTSTTTRQDQEGGLFTTSPGTPLTTSTTIPPKPAECNTIILAFSISTSILIITIIIIITLFVFKFLKLRRSTYAPVPTGSSRETRDEEGTGMNSLNPKTHGRDDVDGRPGKSSDDFKALTAETRETHLPLVGHLLMDDLFRASTGQVKDYMCEVLHSLMDLYGLDPPQQDGKYSSLKKYVWCIPKSVLANGEYLLDVLDHIPVGRKRDVCEILLTMPENQQVKLPMLYENKDIFIEYEQDDQGNTIEHEYISRSRKLGEQMKTILSRSLTRDAARIFISLTILDSPVGNSGSVSFSEQADSTFNQSARETAQNTSVLSQRNGDSGCKDDNLIEFWLSKVIKLQPKVQRDIILKFGGFEQDAVQPSMETTTDPSIMRIPDAKELNKINVNESINQEKEMDPIDMQNVDAKTVKISNLKGSTDQEPQPSTSQPSTSSRRPLTNSQALSIKQELAKIAGSGETLASQLKDLIEKQEKEEKDTCKHEEKAIGCIDMQNYDAKEVKNANLNKSTELNKKSIEIPGEKEKG